MTSPDKSTPEEATVPDPAADTQPRQPGDSTSNGNPTEADIIAQVIANPGFDPVEVAGKQPKPVTRSLGALIGGASVLYIAFTGVTEQISPAKPETVAELKSENRTQKLAIADLNLKLVFAEMPDKCEAKITPFIEPAVMREIDEETAVGYLREATDTDKECGKTAEEVHQNLLAARQAALEKMNLGKPPEDATTSNALEELPAGSKEIIFSLLSLLLSSPLALKVKNDAKNEGSDVTEIRVAKKIQEEVKGAVDIEKCRAAARVLMTKTSAIPNPRFINTILHPVR